MVDDVYNSNIIHEGSSDDNSNSDTARCENHVQDELHTMDICKSQPGGPSHTQEAAIKGSITGRAWYGD